MHNGNIILGIAVSYTVEMSQDEGPGPIIIALAKLCDCSLVQPQLPLSLSERPAVILGVLERSPSGSSEGSLYSMMDQQ